jgi:hypothetical protein
MTADRAVRILNAEAGYEKWSRDEAAALLDGLRSVRNAERSARSPSTRAGVKTLATNREERRCG